MHVLIRLIVLTVSKDRIAMRDSTQRRLFAGLCLLLCWQSGCAAFRPVHGVPARYLPTEMKIGDRSNRRTIDLSLLRQPPPLDPKTGSLVHRIDGGDVLGIYVEGFVGKSTDPPPVYFPINNDTPPSFGMPYPVREDGTISLPFVGSVNVRGMTLGEAEERVKQAYLTPRQLIKPDYHRVQVNLQRPRQYRVLVIRQDSRNEPQSNAFLGQVNIGMVKRGTGKVVNLPVYSNDVLNALTATDGLPGLDAENAVYVIRRRAANQSGTLDPRWPTDLNPDLLRNIGPLGLQSETPIIRGQSPGYSDNAGYHNSNNVTQANFVGQPNQRVQYASGTLPMAPGHGLNIAPPGVDENAPLAPPKIWSDRPVGGQLEYEPQIVQTQYPNQFNQGAPALNDPRYGDPRVNNLPMIPNGGWTPPSAPPTGGLPRSDSIIQSGDRSGLASWRQTDGQLEYNPQIIQTQYPNPMNQGGPTPIDSRYNDPRFRDPRVNNLPMTPNGGWTPPPAPPAGGPPLSNSVMPNNMMNPGSSGPNYPTTPAGPQGAPSNGMSPNGTTPFVPWTPPAVQPDGNPEGGPPLGFQELDPGHGVLTGGGTMDGRHVIRIPIRLGPGETADIRPEDVILYDGDIVFIESRDTEVFYTGGLLGGGQYTLPRDYDLDIMQAISLAQSRGVMGASRAVGGVSALNNDVSISPSTAIVLRKLPDGGEVPIKIDLYRARTDLSERIVIQPGDFILLQYTCLEAVGAFFERNLLETALFGLAAQGLSGNRGN